MLARNNVDHIIKDGKIKMQKVTAKKKVMLKTKAKTSSGGGGKVYEYPVSLELDSDGMKYGGVVLRINNTPGSWYLKTILDKGEKNLPKTISIDYGQNWSCINMDEVLKEALKKVKKIYVLRQEVDMNVDCNNKKLEAGMSVESISDDRLGKIIETLDDNLVQVAYEDETVTVNGRTLLVR